MLEQEIASIYYFVSKVISVTPYFKEVPEDMLVPCVFYPPPEASGKNFSLSTYAVDFIMYAKFIDADTMEACSMALSVLQAIMAGGNKIPLYRQDGSSEGKSFRINNPEAKKVEEGVYQLELSWKRYTAIDITVANKAIEFFVNSTPIGTS